jgi:hypothetical protein
VNRHPAPLFVSLDGMKNKKVLGFTQFWWVLVGFMSAFGLKPMEWIRPKMGWPSSGLVLTISFGWHEK